jgi:hypothetical protein
MIIINSCSLQCGDQYENGVSRKTKFQVIKQKNTNLSHSILNSLFSTITAIMTLKFTHLNLNGHYSLDNL